MTNPIGAIPTPKLTDVFDLHSRNISASLNCLKIGTIQTFNPALCTASVSINSQFVKADGSTLSYPLLTDCPVFVLSGGASRITFPIETGDVCLLLFNDTDIDKWFYLGQVSAPNTLRQHSLSDGIALVGISPLQDVVPVDPTKVVLTAEIEADVKAPIVKVLATAGATVNAGAGTVVIANTLQNLKSLVDSLIDNLNNLYTQVQLITVTTSSFGSPSTTPNNDAAIAAYQTALAAIKTNFDLLLG